MSRCRLLEVFVIPRMVFQRFTFYIFIIVFVSFDLKFKCNRLKTLRYTHTYCNIFAKFTIFDLRYNYSRRNLPKDYLGYFGSYYKTYLETWALSTAE